MFHACAAAHRIGKLELSRRTFCLKASRASGRRARGAGIIDFDGIGMRGRLGDAGSVDDVLDVPSRMPIRHENESGEDSALRLE
jgi:hypothetical protein